MWEYSNPDLIKLAQKILSDIRTDSCLYSVGPSYKMTDRTAGPPVFDTSGCEHFIWRHKAYLLKKTLLLHHCICKVEAHVFLFFHFYLNYLTIYMIYIFLMEKNFVAVWNQCILMIFPWVKLQIGWIWFQRKTKFWRYKFSQKKNVLGLGWKNRVGRGTVNTHNFFFCLMDIYPKTTKW
jgi:hypothetical protein